jgi:GNAT superfamily N-acetyltransferase
MYRSDLYRYNTLLRKQQSSTFIMLAAEPLDADALETPPGIPSNGQTKEGVTINLLADPSSVHASAVSAWKSLFGAKASKPHPDHATFKSTYSHPNGRLLVASTPTEEIAGIIAYRRYDGRFKHPELVFGETVNVVEVVRLFVQPKLRGQGIATSLIRALVERAGEDDVQVMYLHTHPFLPGAQYLWEKEGWRVVVKEDEEPWFTIHMRRDFE